MTTFDRFSGYGFVHHRALNSVASFETALSLLTQYPQQAHIFEGDICWDFSANRALLYFRHPSYIIDTLSPDQVVHATGSQRLLQLQDTQRLKQTNAFLVVELKVGRGDTKTALRSLIDYLEEHFKGRYWIDGFSLSMLEFIKSYKPGTTTSLHTECVYRDRVLVAAPEWPAVRLKKLRDLSSIDAISIRKRGSEGFLKRACHDVSAAGKTLILSRLFGYADFELSKGLGAKAGYVHGDLEAMLIAESRSSAT